MRPNPLLVISSVILLLCTKPAWCQGARTSADGQAQPELVESARATISPPPYRIGPGDILNISVWKDDALTQKLPVLPDGTLHFPLVGKLHAGGMTTDEFKAALEARMKRYVPDPVLSVSVTQINSMVFYVIGRVNTPGRQVLNTNVTALQALAMAGGPNPFAKRNKIKIFREEDNQTLIFHFPYDDIAKGRRLEYNILLKRGDVMVVP